MQKEKKQFRGSVLVFTLLVLSILLSTALSAATVVIVGKNSSRATEKSVLSFQIADGAVENILKRVYNDTDSNLNELAGNLRGTGISGGGNPTCSNGVISGRLPQSLGTYEVTFLDNNGARLQCSGAGYNTYAEWRPLLIRLVSIGTYGSTTRAIDVGVEP